MSEPITGAPELWPHLEACYNLARRAADGFAAPPCREVAFTAARWGLHMGMAIAALDPDFAAAVQAELDSFDLARDGEEATAHARWSMLRDMELLRRLAQRFAEGGAS
ncbi:MAG TPA: hypothetical protein VFA70_09845 [Dehalococcoidia bacterium]|nr:hypothetical protein [Dehalococcoidia bacterium]